MSWLIWRVFYRSKIRPIKYWFYKYRKSYSVYYRLSSFSSKELLTIVLNMCLISKQSTLLLRQRMVLISPCKIMLYILCPWSNVLNALRIINRKWLLIRSNMIVAEQCMVKLQKQYMISTLISESFSQ